MTWPAIPAGAAECLEQLWTAGFAAHIVGGCVRDLLLGRAPGDVDVCTSARPEQVMALFPRAVPTGLRHGTVTVLTEAGGIEVTTFRREGDYADGRHPDAVAFDVGLVEDLSRRDFTINAMALARDGTVIDPFGGQGDLKRKLVRCVGPAGRRFSEDALRMFRGVRFCAQLGFQLEVETARAMKENAFRAEGISGERIKAEVEKTLLSPRPEQVGEMIELGLLSHLYPFPAQVDLSGLTALPAKPEERWRGFCAATGFPISALPVERKLRQAVEHPERALIPTLALKPRDLMELGLQGPAISAVQKKLALHLLARPQDNTPARLRELLPELLAAGEESISGKEKM